MGYRFSRCSFISRENQTEFEKRFDNITFKHMGALKSSVVFSKGLFCYSVMLENASVPSQLMLFLGYMRS